jgi:hypothetical protein
MAMAIGDFSQSFLCNIGGNDTAAAVFYRHLEYIQKGRFIHADILSGC